MRWVTDCDGGLKRLVKLILVGGRWWGKRCARERWNDGFFSSEVSLGGRERERRGRRRIERQTGIERARRRKGNWKREREMARVRSGVREGFWTAWYICDYTRWVYTMRQGVKGDGGIALYILSFFFFLRSLLFSMTSLKLERLVS